VGVPLELVFYGALAFGVLQALGAAFGLVGDHDGGDHDPADHDSGDLPAGGLPLSMRLMFANFLFGGAGLIFGTTLQRAVPGSAGVAAALAVALAAALLGSRGLSRLVARRAPLLQSEAIRRADLVGAVGRLVVAASPAGGAAQVRDRRGNLHQVPCRTASGEPPLPAGSVVLLIDYDETGAVFSVIRGEG
jgi:hypothetical protein